MTTGKNGTWNVTGVGPGVLKLQEFKRGLAKGAVREEKLTPRNGRRG
jgi:hypothetical protein